MNIGLWIPEMYNSNYNHTDISYWFQVLFKINQNTVKMIKIKFKFKMSEIVHIELKHPEIVGFTSVFIPKDEGKLENRNRKAQLVTI